MKSLMLLLLVVALEALTNGEVQRTPQPSCMDERTSYMEILDAESRIFLWHKFLSDEECDYIVQKAELRLERSGVVDTDSGSTKIDSIRTSSGMFFNRAEDPIIEGIERRIANWTLLPVGNQEGLQVLRYQNTQKYDAHWDYFFHKEGTANGGNRVATVLTYLNDVEEGGETTFPKIPAPGGVNEGFSDCAKHVLAVKPRKGDAVLFHSMNYDNTLVDKSLHAACPVIRGIKWSMPKWIHVGHYDMRGDKYDVERAEVLAEQERLEREREAAAHPSVSHPEVAHEAEL